MTTTRRDFLGTSGSLVVAFAMGRPRAAGAQELPRSLGREPSLDSWLRLDASGRITVFSGKCEIGQGIKTALVQIVADELDVGLASVDIVTADTARTPNEGYTAGSMSMQTSGAALRQAAAEVRQILLKEAAGRLGAATGALSVSEGRVRAPNGRGVTYSQLVEGADLRGEARGEAQPKLPGERRLAGTSVPRLDIPAKVFGQAAFVHDLRLDGMVHARVVRPPSYGARLARVRPVVNEVPGALRTHRDGSFLAVVNEREENAVAMAEDLAARAEWEGETELPPADDLDGWLRRQETADGEVSALGVDPASVPSSMRVKASYAKPYLAHGSVAPSCAVAVDRAGELTVWTHSQGVFPLRASLARVLGIAAEKIRCIHMDGAGCYGHNGADDAACDAALLARALPGRPVRVLWSRQDELRWAPFGSAMSIDLEAGLDDSGRVTSWRHDLWSHAHSTRPGRQPTFVAGWHLAEPVPLPSALNIPQPFGGADRNAVPLYDFGSQRIVEHFIRHMPVRVSALRSLGAFANVFAIESFMDVLAAKAGADPIDFRLRHLSDPRGRAVVEAVRESSGWVSPVKAGSGRGFAFTRYKNRGSYLAMVVEVSAAGGAISVDRATAVVDAGEIVNPDGVRNQIEGGIVQAASWALRESVSMDSSRVRSTDWRSYPILRFSEVPEVSVELIDHPELPPLGVGETAQGPTAAAIANAIAAATGERRSTIPLERAVV
ncbi:MAG: molybdopterin cofactor-binding domain-containing protein [Acidobacteriota bacterium]|nr:molybdopterin cofactor-binding domain-containing protein [Acidobacteriota bacterium]